MEQAFIRKHLERKLAKGEDLITMGLITYWASLCQYDCIGKFVHDLRKKGYIGHRIKTDKGHMFLITVNVPAPCT